MNKRWLTGVTLMLLACILATSAYAVSEKYQDMPAGLYRLDKTHASLTWKVSHLGLSNYTARFTRFDAEIDFKPQAPENSRVMVTIDPTSIETDYPYPEKKDFDKKLVQKAEWFNATKFPEIKFTSTAIEMTGENTAIMTGDLTFLGVTKSLSFSVTFNGAMKKQPFSKKPTVGFSATGSLKRSEWGMATYVPNIGDEVMLLIEAEFAKD